jgi:hypothetical protein
MEHVLNENFTDEDFDKVYQDFLAGKTIVRNERIRPDDVSLWDVLAGAQNEFFSSPEGAVIDELAKDVFKNIEPVVRV